MLSLANRYGVTWELLNAFKLTSATAAGCNIFWGSDEEPLTPEFVVVGAAAGLSAAVTRLAQVASVSAGPGAVPRSPQQGQAATGVVLHRTPALPEPSAAPLPTAN